MTSSVSLLPPLEPQLSLVHALFSTHGQKDTSVNLQVAELEQHIYGMTDIGRGITKDQRMIYIYIIYVYISFAQFIPVYVGLAQARPNYLTKLVHFTHYMQWFTC